MSADREEISRPYYANIQNVFKMPWGPAGFGEEDCFKYAIGVFESYKNFGQAVVTNDIYIKEDMQFLVRSEALDPESIIGIETGGCPQTVIREDAPMNLVSLESLTQKRFWTSISICRK